MPGTHRREPFAEREEPIGLLDLMLGSPRSCLRPLAHGNVAGGDNGSDDAAVFIADGREAIARVPFLTRVATQQDTVDIGLGFATQCSGDRPLVWRNQVAGFREYFQ